MTVARSEGQGLGQFQSLTRSTAGLLLLGLLASCLAVSPSFPPNSGRNGTPIFDDLTLAGFMYEGGYQSTLRESIDRHSVTRRLTADSRWQLKGTFVEAQSDTTGGEITWNVINSVTLLCLFGGPYYGSTKGTAKLELYRDEQLVRTYTGTARSEWTASYEVFARTAEAARQSRERAERLAIWDAVAGLAKDPPDVSAR